MIQLKNVAYHYDNKIIFEALNETLPAHQKIGIVGKNGCGKTTLFKLIQNILETSNGEIAYPKNWRIAHLDQQLPSTEDLALEYVMQGDTELEEITQALKSAEQKGDYEKVLNLHQRLADIDGYTAEARAAKIMMGLGFTLDDQIKTVNEFSGGWRMRLKLARILLSRADLLLLDEPTNHLDLSCIVWLETWLKKQKGMMLIISHDRDFLDATVNYVLYIHHYKGKLYRGNYSTFESQRTLELESQQNAFDKQQAQIAHLQHFVDRFKAKATKAKQAQSRVKAIEKMTKIAAVQQEMDIQFTLKDPSCASSTLLSLTRAEFGYDTAKFRKINFSIYKDQRIGLLGANGAGKSTFIKALADKITLDFGQRLSAPKLKIGYFSQDSDQHLDLAHNAIEHMQTLSPETELAKIRSYLGGFGFSQEMALQVMDKCSGGEKMRLMLAMLIWQQPDLLLLDEPTNHLDLSMCNALSLALQSYKGGIVLISHDRYMLNSCVNELWLIDDGKIKPFDGDLNDYQKFLLQNE